MLDRSKMMNAQDALHNRARCNGFAVKGMYSAREELNDEALKESS